MLWLKVKIRNVKIKLLLVVFMFITLCKKIYHSFVRNKPKKEIFVPLHGTKEI